MVDYVPMDFPITPVFSTTQDNLRFIYSWRISVKCGDKYIPMTFAFDSGAIVEFQLTKEAFVLLTKFKRVVNDKMQLSVVGSEDVYEARCVSSKTRKTNMIGLKFIQSFGFHVVDGQGQLDHPFDYL